MPEQMSETVTPEMVIEAARKKWPDSHFHLLLDQEWYPGGTTDSQVEIRVYSDPKLWPDDLLQNEMGDSFAELLQKIEANR